MAIASPSYQRLKMLDLLVLHSKLEEEKEKEKKELLFSMFSMMLLVVPYDDELNVQVVTYLLNDLSKQFRVHSIVFLIYLNALVVVLLYHYHSLHVVHIQELNQRSQRQE